MNICDKCKKYWESKYTSTLLNGVPGINDDVYCQPCKASILNDLNNMLSKIESLKTTFSKWDDKDKLC